MPGVMHMAREHARLLFRDHSEQTFAGKGPRGTATGRRFCGPHFFFLSTYVGKMDPRSGGRYFG